jgi:hypothetical protein
MPYREDRDALIAKKDVLERDLAEIAAKKNELGDLHQQERVVSERLNDTKRTLDAIDGAQAVSFLDRVSVAAPCKADWGDMVGDDRVRFCGQCAKNVYNLSAMQRAEAEAFVRAHESNVCIRLYRRTDGTVLTADCPVGVKKRRVRLAIAGAVGGGLMAGAAAFALTSIGRENHPPVMMGEMVAIDPPTPTPPPTTTPQDSPEMGQWVAGGIRPMPIDPPKPANTTTTRTAHPGPKHHR